jgi:electron transport complex protein RnfA
VIRLATLGICASLAMNLVTQFGLGLAILAGGAETGAGARDAKDGKDSRDGRGAPAEAGLPAFLGLSASLFLLWAFFTCALGPLSPGLYWYLLLYPLSVVLVKGLGRLFVKTGGRGPARDRGRFLPGIKSPGSFFSLPPDRAEFLPPGLLVSLHLALGPLEALVLALGFSLGLCLSLGILREIRRRSRFEAVPPLLRGGPLALISLGLLSLIFTSASLMFFNLSIP